MIQLKELPYDRAASIADIDALEQRLKDVSAEIGETELHELFSDRPQLLLALGDIYGPIMLPGAYQDEQGLFGEFRTDFIVSDEERSRFLFIEFEDAKVDSIFKQKNHSGSTSPSFEWSSRLEHGLSQVLDWHFRVDDYRSSSKITETFGPDFLTYEGLVVIGRDEFLRRQGLKRRFEWRVQKTVVDSKNIRCVTFDHLLRELQGRVKSLRAVS